MGNSAASFGIELEGNLEGDNNQEEEALRAGTTLRGNVSVAILNNQFITNTNNKKNKRKSLIKNKKDTNNKNDGKLRIVFSGKESTKVLGRQYLYETSASFFQLGATLHDTTATDVKQPVPGETYDIPFVMPLPASLPSSTFRNMFDEGIFIEYKLFLYFNDQVCYEQNIQVVSAHLSPDEKVPCIVPPTSHPITTLGGIKRGLLFLGASIPNTHVGKGKRIEVSTACQNLSTVDISRVTVQLKEKYYWATGIPSKDSEESILNKSLKNISLRDVDDDDDNGDEDDDDDDIDNNDRNNDRNFEVFQEEFSERGPDGITGKIDGKKFKFQTHKKDENGNTLLTRTETFIVSEIADLDKPGLIRGKIDKSELKSITDDAESQQQIYRRLYDDLVTSNRAGNNDNRKSNKFEIVIPKEIRDSYQGKLINISHYLKIILRTPNLTSNPSIYIPLKIGSSPSPSSPPLNNTNNANTTGATNTARFASGDPSQRITLSDVVVPRENIILERNEGSIEESRAMMVSRSSILGDNGPIIEEDQEVLRVVENDNEDKEDNSQKDEDKETLPPTPQAPSTTDDSNDPFAPSLEKLLTSMSVSSAVGDYEIISQMIDDDEWNLFLSTQLTPEDFGMVIAHVKTDFDQPRVATLLASTIATTSSNLGCSSNFKCQHCAIAVMNSADWIRTTMVQELLPYCADITTNHACIKTVLNEWEIIATMNDFEEAIFVASSSVNT